MFEHKSGLPFAIDRAAGKSEQQSVVFYGKRPFVQAPELNELQTIARGRHDRLGRLVAKDGDRVDGAFAIVDGTTVTMTAGKIYVSGDVMPVAAATILNIPLVGTITIGVNLIRTYITHNQDSTLLGVVPGLSEGEAGAARETVRIVWVRGDVARSGEYYAVYTLRDGVILDQTPPPILDGVKQALALYDRPHGNYIVSGCRVTALGLSAGDQVFSIEQGEANILGFKNTRYASLRITEIEDWDEAAVPGETQTYIGGASQVISLDKTPLSVINSILLTKEKTATITRGATAAGADALPDSSVIQIIEVKQGATTYIAATDYVRTNSNVDWAPGGAEPTTGSSYTVKYRYRASVSADTSTPKTITVSGGATGGDVIISYTCKMPRLDILCLDQSGIPVYLKGASAKADALPPIVPRELLALCTITNNWGEKASVENDGVPSIPYNEMWRIFREVSNLNRLLQLERIKSGVDAREPVAKKNMFVDGFLDNAFRDEGVAQTAAVGDGILQLAITPTFYFGTLTAPVMLDYTEEVITSQALKTACAKINPYANFTALPGTITLTPSADFWTTTQTQWSSPATIEFNAGTLTVRQQSPLLERGSFTTSSTRRVTSSSSDASIGERKELETFLRPITVAFAIAGFGAGEILTSLAFDGRNVKPAGTITASATGTISGSFTIPTNIPVGTKAVLAVGAGGTTARGLFTGQGVIDITVMRRTTTIRNQTTNTIVEGNRVTPQQQQQQNGGTAAENGPDPQAQLFAVSEQRQIVGVDFHLCALGSLNNHIILDQVSVDNGYPTKDVQAQAFVSMTGAAVGWKSGRYTLPLSTGADRLHAFVIKTDDADHSISLAGLGGFDADLQQYVAAHPYSIGPRFSSVNAATWTAHQEEALSFRLVAAKYTTLTKTVALGSFAVVNASDLQVRAVVELPSSDCDVTFEIERPNGTIYRVRPHQVIKLNEYITETLVLRAILTGSPKLSPILYAPVLFIAGSIAATGTYVTRAFKFGVGINLTAYNKVFLPSGATAVMEYDKADNSWINMPVAATEALADPKWVERKHSATGITSNFGRLKITITGGPAARPEIYDLGAAVM